MGILLPTHGLGTEIIQRLRGPNCQIILIAPLSLKEQLLGSALLNLAVVLPRKISFSLNLLKQPRSRVFHPCPDRLYRHVWLLYRWPCKTNCLKLHLWRESREQEDTLL